MSDIVPQETPQFKQCFKCQKLFPATSTYFTKHPQKKDGWNPSCKACKNGKPIVIKEIIPEGMKQCSKCKNVYEAANANFAIDKSRPDGLFSNCKVCVNVYAQIYNDAHKEEHAQYRQEHREEIREKDKAYYQANKEEILPKNKLYRQSHTKEIASSKSRYSQSQHGRETRRKHYQENKDWIITRNRRYRAANRDKVSEWSKKSYSSHKEARMAYLRQYYQEHKEALRQYKQDYYKTPHGRAIARAGRHRREARERAIKGTLTAQEIQTKLKAQKHKCYYCFTKFKKSEGKYIYHLEHTVPLSRTEYNPRHDVNNVVLSCPTCNLRKNDKLPHEWAEGGRLF